MTALAADGDVRIDNRAEVRSALGRVDAMHGAGGDHEIVAEAYARWGDRCVEHLSGDFAFVLTDRRAGRTIAARDPMGVRPLYYRVSGGTIAFGSSALAVGARDGHPLALDETRIADALIPALECADGARTFYIGVRRLPPGHLLSFSAGRLSVARFWSPDPSRELRLAGDRDYVEAFREVFRESVRCRLAGRASAMLSGGLDSSAIVGFARALAIERGEAPLVTLSAITDDAGCEETRHVRSVLGLPGLDPVLVRPADVEAMRDEIDRFLGGLDEPFDATMILPMMIYAAARHRGLEAVLDGLDGDVVASHEPDFLAGLIAQRRWGAAVREARALASFYDGTYAPWSSSVRLIAANAARAFSPLAARRVWRHIRRPRSVREALRESVIREDFAARTGIADRLSTLWSLRGARRGWSPRERHALELTHPSIGAALERYDRVARSQGIEPRHPFLDRRVVELCLALPWDRKVRDGWTKRIVREATEGLLPDEVRWRRGRWVRLGPGFLASVNRTQRGGLRRALDDGMEEIAPYVDPRKLRLHVARHDAGDEVSGEILLQTAAFAMWLRNRKAREYDPPARAIRGDAMSRLPAAG